VGRKFGLKLSAVESLLKLSRVERSQLRISLGKPDQVQFVLLAFAWTAMWIAVGPELAARNVLQACNSHVNSQHHGLY